MRLYSKNKIKLHCLLRFACETTDNEGFFRHKKGMANILTFIFLISFAHKLRTNIYKVSPVLLVTEY